jgi:hypothetical protein
MAATNPQPSQYIHEKSQCMFHVSATFAAIHKNIGSIEATFAAHAQNY